jgi:uncharacterized membrane protein
MRVLHIVATVLSVVTLAIVLYIQHTIRNDHPLPTFYWVAYALGPALLLAFGFLALTLVGRFLPKNSTRR